MNVGRLFDCGIWVAAVAIHATQVNGRFFVRIATVLVAGNAADALRIGLSFRLSK